MHALVDAPSGGLVGQKKGRSAFGMWRRVREELAMVRHQSTPGRKKNLGLHTRLVVQVGRLGDWMAERTMRRCGIQMHMLTYVCPGEALQLGFWGGRR